MKSIVHRGLAVPDLALADENIDAVGMDATLTAT
jgi:hypothetical protein